MYRSFHELLQIYFELFNIETVHLYTNIMIKEISINLCNFLLSLSDAVDLANTSIASHQMRTAFIAWQMAKRANLSENTIGKIFIAALFHDIGALTPEDKVELHQFEVQDLNAHC